MNEVARILVYGDLHLSSKNYGAHFDYPKDSLNSLKTVTNKAEEFKATHIIGLGDLTFGRFSNLEYRADVEKELEKQFKLTDGRRYELKGNHDTAGYGMTEFEYYIAKGLIKPACNFSIGNIHISMIDFGQHLKTEPNIIVEEGHTNILFMHDYFKFSDSKLPNYGNAIELDNFTKWFGVDHIVGGHIHSSELFDGLIVKKTDAGTISHRATVDYLGSLSRPAYREGHTDEVGHLLEITIYDNNSFKYDRLDIELPSIENTFNIEVKEKDKEKAEAKKNMINISDVIKNLDEHERNIGNPEDIIAGLDGIDERYKKKAIELLKLGEA